MAARGKHRRPRMNTLTRGIVAAGTGGAALALPIVGATGAHAAQPTQAAQARTGRGPAGLAVTYKVVSGDTLTKIAKKHSTSGGWQNLYKANRAVIGDDPAVIRPGLKLTVGTKNAQTSRRRPPRPRPPPRPPSPPPPRRRTRTTSTAGSRNRWTSWPQQGIPGSYDGIYRNVMRESSGNPQAMNNWDSNAAAGTPSKGLLQTIDPTFNAYHVAGTSMDPFDPVANITAACNYAAARYGSIDNVFGAY